MKGIKLNVLIFILVILVVCIFLFVYLAVSNKKEFFEPDLETGEYDVEKIKKEAVIPLHIYQTWHTKDLSPKMRECVDKLKKANPEFTHHLYDDEDCREFIKNNFEPVVLNTFDRLIPGAYKADLWRYCILYKKGGIYLDIKYEPINFKLISLINKEFFVKEYDSGGWEYVNDNPQFLPDAVYTGLMISKPNNKKYIKMINAICDNVKNNFYGIRPTHPTGPTLFRNFFTQSEFNNIEYVYFEADNIGYVRNIKTKKDIFKFYDGYREEQNDSNKDYYKDLWTQRKIYK
jgi:mannosyltransferase OCH1-like enzyme